MFRIDPTSATPPFEQLRGQVIEQVKSGRLASGAKLPTVRGLAVDLGVAANTVARAYRELEADGIIETRGRAGTFVAAAGDASERRVQELARQFAADVRRLGVDENAALDWVEAALRS
ncbi:GntR family transcriptional regulator [Salinibacterium sp. dk2585]|uniref:GntR family transcriptional regulator n=1 Tax=unclassified Salinibacterium TaxID=2632331 RepID=UPI0011C24B00|nr:MULTISPECIES: GntR family transcriptional regulator [unclassified Salinibacterium]QEE61839.1 GntR family transcriptional regulator [Salinibacterium sp. dk2585]TXK54606.1 GntR family transcriptional regulator [Salinibacterium sp. dk5596]